MTAYLLTSRGDAPILLLSVTTPNEPQRGKEMTRKDYELLADAIRYSISINRYHPQAEQRIMAIGFVINELADRLIRENPRFDRKRFEKACSPTE